MSRRRRGMRYIKRRRKEWRNKDENNLYSFPHTVTSLALLFSSYSFPHVSFSPFFITLLLPFFFSFIVLVIFSFSPFYFLFLSFVSFRLFSFLLTFFSFISFFSKHPQVLSLSCSLLFNHIFITSSLIPLSSYS